VETGLPMYCRNTLQHSNTATSRVVKFCSTLKHIIRRALRVVEAPEKYAYVNEDIILQLSRLCFVFSLFLFDYNLQTSSSSRIDCPNIDHQEYS
jgi:hypothetical protein